MPQSHRPFFQKSTAELRGLLDAEYDNVENLELIANELKIRAVRNRHSPAHALLPEVKERLKQLTTLGSTNELVRALKISELERKKLITAISDLQKERDCIQKARDARSKVAEGDEFWITNGDRINKHVVGQIDFELASDVMRLSSYEGLASRSVGGTIRDEVQIHEANEIWYICRIVKRPKGTSIKITLEG